MIIKGTPQSGTSKITAIQYPQFRPFEQNYTHIYNTTCYIITKYKPGVSVIIARHPPKDLVTITCGDWVGNYLDLTQNESHQVQSKKFIEKHLVTFIKIMHTIKLEQAQFFLDIDSALVDIYITGKMASPGMINDIFGKIYPTQTIAKIEVLNDRVLECIKTGIGAYAGDLIIKPSRVKLIDSLPLYLEVVR